MEKEKRHIDFILEYPCPTLNDYNRSFNHIKDNKAAVKGRLLNSIDALNFMIRELENDSNNLEIKKRIDVIANFLYKHLKNGNLDLINVHYSIKDTIKEIVNGNI